MASNDIGARRGEIWLTAFGAGRTGEPTKTRPAVVLTSDRQSTGSAFDLVCVAPVSASLPVLMGRPAVSATLQNGLASDSVVMVPASRSVARSRLLRRLGRMDDGTMARVDRILEALLGLPV